MLMKPICKGTPPSRILDTGGSSGLQEQSQCLQVWVYACATGACNCTLSTICKGSIERQIIVAPDQWSERSIMSHYVAVCECMEDSCGPLRI